MVATGPVGDSDMADGVPELARGAPRCTTGPAVGIGGREPVLVIGVGNADRSDDVIDRVGVSLEAEGPATRNYDPCISCATRFLKPDLRRESPR
jgi:hypothetical protein